MTSQIGIASRPFRLATLAEIAGCGAFAVSVLSGKMRLPSGRFGLEDTAWLDVRLYATLAALLLLISLFRRVRLERAALVGAASLFAFLAYMVIRSFYDPGEMTAAKQIDAIYLFAQVALAGAIAADADRLRDLAVWILAISAAYLAVTVAGQLVEELGRRQNYGLGWGPVGSAVTFSRVMFLACCVALCFVRPRWTVASWVVFGTALAFLFATWASLQKAAIGASLLALAVFFGFLIRARSWKQLSAFAAVLLIAGGGMWWAFGERIAYRLSVTIYSAENPSPAKEDQDVAGFEVRTRYCYFVPNPQQPDELVRACRRDIYVDQTSRLLFAAEALRGIAIAPIIGHGMGNFLVIAQYPETFVPDPYFYPHNLFLEVAYEGGSIGLGLLLIALFSVAGGAIHSAAPAQPKMAIGAFAIFLFVTALFSGDLYDSRLLWIAGIILAAWRPRPWREA